MKVTKHNKLILKLKFWRFLCSEAFAFLGTLGLLIGIGFAINGISYSVFIFSLVIHFLFYTFWVKKYVGELSEEKKKFNDIIIKLNNRKVQSRNIVM